MMSRRLSTYPESGYETLGRCAVPLLSQIIVIIPREKVQVVYVGEGNWETMTGRTLEAYNKIVVCGR